MRYAIQWVRLLSDILTIDIGNPVIKHQMRSVVVRNGELSGELKGKPLGAMPRGCRLRPSLLDRITPLALTPIDYLATRGYDPEWE